MIGDPLVSIVLPTYNGARYLNQAIQSCLSQTYSHWELIIVDDASTDDTPVRIAENVARDTRIRSMRHETNRKLPGALNTGFSQAKGEFLTWTSDDNFYRPWALTEMVSFLQRHQEIGVVYTDYSVVTNEGGFVKQVQVAPPEELLKRNPIGPCFLYRRKVQQVFSYYSEDVFLAEDYDFWLRTSAVFQLAPFHRDLYCYRTRDTSLTSLHIKSVRVAADKALGRALPKMRFIDRTARAECFLDLARRAYYRKDIIRVQKCLFWAVIFSPRLVLRYLIKKVISRNVVRGHAS